MNKELFLALIAGDASLIKGLDRQVLLEVTFEGDTPLHIAAREGHQPIVQWILSEKCCKAAREGHRPFVEWILPKKYCMAAAKNNDDNTPLHEAAKCNNLDLVKDLLQHRKQSAYHYNKFGETGMVIACKYGHVETVKLLCDAKKYIGTMEMQKCLRLAGYMGYSDIVTRILDKSKVPLYSNSCQRLLGCLSGLLVGYEDEACIENRRAIPSLVAAVHGGNLETVKAALKFVSSHQDLMTEKDKFGMCAIHVAAIKDGSDIIDEFISTWPDCVEIRTSDHKTLFHVAVVRKLLSYKDAEKVAQLVSHDEDCFHNTALHLAAEKGVDPQLVEYLISLEGVDVNGVNGDDMTALDIASAAANDNTNSNFARIEELLESVGGIRLSHKPKYDRSICDSEKKEDRDTIKSSTASQSRQLQYKDIVNTHMVVAALIATVTFAAILTIPVGIEDDKNSVHYGAAKMAFRHLFKFFLFSNTAAFITSFTLIVAWLVRQLIGDSYFERRSILSHMSVVTLIVSICWTTASFVSATIIIILPANFEDLRSTHKEAFSKYKSLWQQEIFFVFLSILYPGMPLLFSILNALRIRKILMKNRKFGIIVTTYFLLFAVTAFIIYGTFKPFHPSMPHF